MHNCPECDSDAVHRSRVQSRWEAWRREFTGKRPFRCHACGWRGWGPEVDHEEDPLQDPIGELMVPGGDEQQPRAVARFESLDAAFEAIDPADSSDDEK